MVEKKRCSGCGHDEAEGCGCPPKSKGCNSCNQMKKENAAMRKAITETNANYVEVVNENLSLRRIIEDLNKLADNLISKILT